MNEFKCRIGLGVKFEGKEIEFSLERTLPFVPQSGMSLLLPGMTHESKINHVLYAETDPRNFFFEVSSLSVKDLYQHHIQQLIQAGWKKKG
jgi:hypothetical protein